MSTDKICRDEDRYPVDCIVSDGGQRFDERFAALSSYQRRFILYQLEENDRASLTELSQQIAAREYQRPVEDVSNDVIAEVRTRLYHHHLQKLREADIVEYDDRTETVVYRDPPELVEKCLQHCKKHEFPD